MATLLLTTCARRAIKLNAALHLRPTFHRHAARIASVADTRTKLATGELKVIYRFPYIIAVRIFCRAKLLQTWLALAAIPTTAITSYVSLTQWDLFVTSSAIGLLATGMLYVISEVSRRAIGIIYVHKGLNVIRIAYLSFWGHRIDVDVPVDDVIPLADINESPDDAFNKVRMYTDAQYWYISVRFGHIVDKDAFEGVFGSVGDGSRKM